MNIENGNDNSGTPPTEPTEPSLINQDPPKSEDNEDPPKADDPPADPSKEDSAEEVVPLTADDITIPDGYSVDDELRDEFLGVLNNRELSPKEQGQALIDLQLKAVQKASETSSAAWTEMQTQWKGEVKADAEVGGDKLQPALANINRLINEYGSDEVVKVLDLTGAGNNVHMIKMFAKIADKLVEPEAPASGLPTNQRGDAASRMFPSMKG